MELYILSVWKNHESPKEWLYDISPMEQYFRNSFTCLADYKQPYYYTPIFKGSHEECYKVAGELKSLIYGAPDPENVKEIIKGYLRAYSS